MKVKAKSKSALLWGVASSMLLLGACAGAGGGSSAPGSAPGTEVTPVPLGQSLAELTGTESAEFQEGLTAFQSAEDAADGLGPVFNAPSCVSCHSAGATGGAAPDTTVALVTRIGGIVDGKYSDLVEFGGPVLQARSLRELDASYPIGPEVVPPEAQFVSHRTTTPLFGLGLIEAIPDSTILAGASAAKPDGIKGRANMVTNPINGKTEVGRFGWKAQVSNLEVFAGDAYLNEMGITTPLFPHENNPQGQPIPPELDAANDPEDTEDAQLFAAYMRFLAPPVRSETTFPAISVGEETFQQIGCASCHTPAMTTGDNASPALSNKIVRLYSDLLLHRIGADLADGIVQGQAEGDMFKTAPLWGISQRKFLLHDGRATTIEDAISFHGGEALQVKQRFNSLPAEKQKSLVNFVKTL